MPLAVARARPLFLSDATVARLSCWVPRAAHEIALNHKKQLAVEFLAARYADLRAQMDKLDFALAAPQRVEALELKITGARYCSIQGHLAMSIKLEDNNGKRNTLYERSLMDMPPVDSDEQYTIDDVLIRQWHEADLFVGLASGVN